MGWHICEECFVGMDEHPACGCDACEAARPSVIFPNPCCEACPCGSFGLMHREAVGSEGAEGE